LAFSEDGKLEFSAGFPQLAPIETTFFPHRCQLDAGKRPMLDERPILDAGCWILDKRPMLDTGCWMPDKRPMPDTGCRMLDTGYWILDKRPILDAGWLSGG